MAAAEDDGTLTAALEQREAGRDGKHGLRLNILRGLALATTSGSRAFCRGHVLEEEATVAGQQDAG